MKTKKFTSIFVSVFVLLLSIVVSVYAAWGYGGEEAPYTGELTEWQISGPGIASYAYDMKWTESSIANMKFDGTNEWLDQTADCTVDSPGGDRLHPTSMTTNIPNYGAFNYNDCGNPTWKEEYELKINPYSLSETTTYNQYIEWNCAYGGALGDINISMEPSSLGHEWLDKTSYNCGSSTSSANKYLINAFSSNASNTSKIITGEGKSELLRDAENGIFSYQVVRTSGDNLRVYSDVDFRDEQILAAYQFENRKQLDTLLSNEVQNSQLLVVVTFSTPLSIEEAQDLVQTAQMEVVSYGIFGRIGDEVVSTYKTPLSNSIEDISLAENATENEVVYDGVMTITGFVNQNGLKVVSNHQAVSLLDLTAHSIQSELNDLGETIELENFAIPNPAWLIYSGEIDITR